jgi:hypothetical protein
MVGRQAGVLRVGGLIHDTESPAVGVRKKQAEMVVDYSMDAQAIVSSIGSSTS